MTREELLAALAPALDTLATSDAARPAEARAALASLDVSAIRAALVAAHGEGWLTPKENAGIRFGRLAKASPETRGFSIDVVDMNAAAPAPHLHPRGEFDLAFSIEGAARFDGHGDGWFVYPPGSRHVPCVTGGRMLIAYFLPGGEIAFEAG
ncbi:MAG: DUF4863 family protein [Myxococcota bacterium]